MKANIQFDFACEALPRVPEYESRLRPVLKKEGIVDCGPGSEWLKIMRVVLSKTHHKKLIEMHREYVRDFEISNRNMPFIFKKCEADKSVKKDYFQVIEAPNVEQTPPINE